MSDPIDPSAATLGDEVLCQVAELCRVPAATRDEFFEDIRRDVQIAHRRDGVAKGGPASRESAQAARTLYDTIGNLTNDERAVIDEMLGGEIKFAFDRISSGGAEGLKHTAYQLAHLFSLLIGRGTPRYPHMPPPPHKRGPKLGMAASGTFQDFFCDLYIHTTLAGGEVTFDKNGPMGTLVDAIKLLIPHLPDGLVPDPLPGSTLQRLKAWCDRQLQMAPDHN